MTSALLRRTALYPQHKALGARFVAFAGWEIPVQYRGILEEHQVVREGAGLFDVSHMGRLEVSGPDAARLLRYVCSYDVTRLAPGQGHYTLLCRDDGGIKDDIYVSRPEEGRFLVVTNAVNAESDREWIGAHKPQEAAVEVRDVQAATAMLAFQGPGAAACLAAVAPPPIVEGLAPRCCVDGAPVAGRSAFVSRTGYTGEDGFELVVAAEDGATVWAALLEAGAQPCGLGARDTLRLEAALPLYGNEIDAGVNPFEAGLGWVVSFDDGADFVGRGALLRLRERGPERALVCLRAGGAGIPRAGCAILHEGQAVGRVTSGGYSPSLRCGIALGYVPVALRQEGTALMVDVRGKALPVQVVRRPFYKRQAQE